MKRSEMMNKLMLGILIGVLSVPLYNDVVEIADYYDVKPEKISRWFVPSSGIADVVTGSCTKDAAKNGHGWVFILREYYNCNKVQIFFSDMIHGEYRKTRNPELEKQVCNGCKL